MRKAQWYVVQVIGGKEDHLCALIRVACAPKPGEQDDPPLLEECFSPRYQTQRKFHKVWRTVQKPLIPGYVIAVTKDPYALALRLTRIPELTRIVGVGGTYVPLREEERMWFEQVTKRGERVVPMSIAYKSGDTVTVTDGPLKGREAHITRINRSKSMAIIELHVGGIRITSHVGLAVLNAPAPAAEPASVAAPDPAAASASTKPVPTHTQKGTS